MGNGASTHKRSAVVPDKVTNLFTNPANKSAFKSFLMSHAEENLAMLEVRLWQYGRMASKNRLTQTLSPLQPSYHYTQSHSTTTKTHTNTQKTHTKTPHLTHIQNFEALHAQDRASQAASAAEVRSAFEGKGPGGPGGTGKGSGSDTPLGAAMRTADSSSVLAMSIALYPQFLAYQQDHEDTEGMSMGDEKGKGEVRGASSVEEEAYHAYISQSHRDDADEQEHSYETVEHAISHIDSAEVERLHASHASGSWLASLLVAVETLPVCVSIASASRDRPGFPLIYVNHFFEVTTGYSRSDIVGRNCKFLQRYVTQSLDTHIIYNTPSLYIYANTYTLSIHTHIYYHLPYLLVGAGRRIASDDSVRL
jgi:hypothetical protein